MEISLENFISDLAGIESLDKLFDFFSDTTLNLGFHAYTFGLMPWNTGENDQDRALLISTVSATFQKAYFEMEAQKFDPVFKEMATRYQPFLKSSLRKKFDRIEGGRIVQKLADEYDIGDAIMIPLPTANFSRAVVLFSHEPEEQFQARFKRQGHFYRSLAAYLAARAEELHIGDQFQPDIQLTKREKACLRLASHGMSGVSIADRLGIKERTVRFHIANAAKKLGVEKPSQAVMRGLRLGLLSD